MPVNFVPIMIPEDFRVFLQSVKGDLSYEKYIKSQFDILLELQEWKLSKLRDENWQRPDDILKDKSASEKADKHTDGNEPYGLDGLI
jgi:hypothetical protein